MKFIKLPKLKVFDHHKNTTLVISADFEKLKKDVFVPYLTELENFDPSWTENFAP